MIDHLADCLADLPAFLGGHMLLSTAALGGGLALSLPLGILAARRRRLAEWILSIAGVVQTVPSLALLALMVPVLGGRIGFLPALLALTLYSILPILSATVVGIRGVDPAMTEAALGLGMSGGQLLGRVLLPLAAPVIIGGVRTSAVLVVGTATLATPVGCTTLGNYIFMGLEMNDQVVIVFGCVLAAALAVALDQLIRLLEVAARRRDRALAACAAAGLAAVVLLGLSRPIARLLVPPRDPVVVGSGPFTEQHILADVLGETLAAGAFTVDQRKGMAETIQFLSLRDGSIDCCVNYTGNVWTTLMKREDVLDRGATFEAASRFLRERYGVLALGSLGFENAYALAVTREAADRHGLRTVADLAAHAPGWRIAGDLQFFGRSEWDRVRERYGLRFRRTLPMDPTLMYDAVARGSVDVIAAYTSDGRVAAYDLVVLEDPLRAFPPYDAMLLVSARMAARPDFLAALRPLVGSIPVEEMRRANRRVDVDRVTARRAAGELLGRLARPAPRLSLRTGTRPSRGRRRSRRGR